jgi:hypothetical protein
MRSPAATSVGGAGIGSLGPSREGSAGLGLGETPPPGGGRDSGFGDGTIGGNATARAPGGCGRCIAGGDVVSGAAGSGTGGGRVGAGAGSGGATGTGFGSGGVGASAGFGSATSKGNGATGVGAGAGSGGRSLLQNGHRTARAGICSAQKRQVLVASMVIFQKETPTLS